MRTIYVLVIERFNEIDGTEYKVRLFERFQNAQTAMYEVFGEYLKTCKNDEYETTKDKKYCSVFGKNHTSRGISLSIEESQTED